MSKKFGIKVISNACGIVPHTIRTWENRYQVFTPERDQNGQRLYDEKDLKKAKLISMLLDSGHTISKVARLTIEELESLLNINPKSANEPFNEDDYQTKVSLKKLFMDLSNYQIDGVADEIEHLRMRLGAKGFVFGVVLPVMQEIGKLQATGTYSVTQEHIVSTIVRNQLGQISLPNIGSSKDRIVLATPDGNLHELSIIIADILCRANRMSTSYLGASHPPQCLAEAINALKANTLVMGAVSSDNWNYEKSIITYLKQMDSFLNRKLNVVLGGGFPLDFPEFENIQSVNVIENFEEFDHQLGRQEFSLSN
jgi:DNA-binding transcriptional MerR regulator